MQGIVTVFGSSSARPGDSDYTMALRLGGLLAQAGFIVKNGGYGGTMEAGSKGAVESGGKAIGVLLKGFWGNEGNRWLSDRTRTADLYERLRALIDSSDAFVVLPGSSGTLAEIALLLEMTTKRIIPAVPIIFIGDYWKTFLLFFDGITVKADNLYSIVDQPEDVITILEKAEKVKKS